MSDIVRWESTTQSEGSFAYFIDTQETRYVVCAVGIFSIDHLTYSRICINVYARVCLMFNIAVSARWM